MKELKVELTFTEMVLGTSSGNPDIHRDFIASNAPDAKTREEEVEAIGVDGVEKKEMTVFPRLEDGTPFVYDYQVRGFFKAACGMMKNVSGSESSKIKAYKKYIDGLVFVNERKIPFDFQGEIGSLQRPLRGQTAQGERISLANSESIPAGAKISFTIRSLKDDLLPAIIEWLDYGKYNGLGQWRNGGYGRFTWKDITDK